jgi:predicted RNase H-like HicB family nuclease
MTYTFRTIIQKDGKYFHGYVPALLGCHTFGKSIEETQKNLSDAIKIHIESIAQEKGSIPQDTSFESFQTVTLSKEYA